MKKISLQFMVVPDALKKYAYVKNPVKVMIIKPKSSLLNKYLGQSGKKLAKLGVSFYFTRQLAKILISKKVAIEII